MSSDEGGHVVERYAAAWTAGDRARLIDCYHDDLTLHWFGRNRLAGRHHGRPAALAALAEFAGRTKRQLLAVEDIVSGSERTVLVAREALGKGASRTEVERVLVFATRDDLIHDCWVYDQDQRLIDELVEGPAT